jgi:hypothetical protein
MVLLITYDLKAPGRDYTGLYEAIKSSKTWWHHLDSVWIIQTAATPRQWYDHLKPHLDANDLMLIIEVKDNSWGILPEPAWKWLSERTYL